jgi:glycosyltransferase involved in cell wall biosynthesis
MEKNSISDEIQKTNNKNTNNKNKTHISVIIPLYNEENTIKSVIERIPNHQHFEIIIVDDGSKDNSIKRVQEINNRDIKIIKHDINQGYGAAILTGFKHATGDIIITMDSDGQHNPEEIHHLIEPIINNQTDVVIGSRYLGKYNYKPPMHSRVGSYIITLALWLIYLRKVYDNQSGFRAYRKEIKKLLKDMKYTGMGFSTEILFKAAFNQLRIAEVPISVNPREFGVSYVNLIKITISVFFCILYYLLRKFKMDLKHPFITKTLNYVYNNLKDNKLIRKIFKI